MHSQRIKKDKPPKLPPNTEFKLNLVTLVKFIISIKKFLHKQKNHVLQKTKLYFHRTI